MTIRNPILRFLAVLTIPLWIVPFAVGWYAYAVGVEIAGVVRGLYEMLTPHDREP